MSSQNTYFVNVDGLYRDNSIWPNPTDFGINFTTFSGTGIYVQGDPLNADSFFQQASIDPDYLDNNLQFVNATTQQIDRTSTSLTVSGLFDYNLGMQINYLSNVLYTNTGYSYPVASPFPNSIYYVLMNVPFLAKFSFDSNASVPYSLSWIFFIRPSAVPSIYYNISSKSTFQLSGNGDYYWLFDFSMRQFDFVVYKNGVNNTLTSAYNPTIDLRTEVDRNGNYGYVCACLGLVNQDGDIGIVNKHAYGYHIFSNSFNVSGSEINGQNSLLVDQSDNTLLSLNVDPFTFTNPKTSYNLYSRNTYGSPSWAGYLYSDNNQNGNPSYFFENASGTVSAWFNQIALSPNLTNFASGSYDIFFLVDNPTQPYMDFVIVTPETGSAASLWVNSNIFFTGSGNWFYWNSNLPNLSLTGSTNTKIYTLDTNTFNLFNVQTVPTTGAASCAMCQVGGITYLFSQNIANYMDVYSFNTTTFALTRLTGIQIPDTYIFTRNVFTTKIGTDIFVFSIPKVNGSSPAAYWLLVEGIVFVTKFDTLTNTASIINSFKMCKDSGYNAQALSFRPNKTYLYSVNIAQNKIDCFDITNPYSISKKTSIDGNSTSNVFVWSQTIAGSTKYYIVNNQIGGGQNRAIFDITDVDNPVQIGNNIKSIGVQPGEIGGIYNNYFYGREAQGFVGSSTAFNFFKREKTPFLDQTMLSSQYSQNIALTLSVPTGAVRCATFTQNDQVFVSVISKTALTTYNITSVRSTQFVSSIPLSISTTIYDMQTINFNGSQYFLVCCLGVIICFILLPSLNSIVYQGIFSAIPDAYSESKLFIYNNNLFAMVGSYTSRIYRFGLFPTLTLTAPPFLTIAGKIPALVMCYLEPSINKQVLIATTTNFLTTNDFYWYFDVGTGLTLIGSTFVTAPGAQPRSGSQVVNPKTSLTYGVGYANIGWGIFDINKVDITLSGFIFLNTQAVNIPTNLNGMTRLFYTDTMYCIVNQYGGPGTFGDYLTCFDFTQPDYGIQIFKNNIVSVGTGASTGSPLVNLDIQIAQLGDRVTLCTLNNNGTLYLYDISNPIFAGQTQSVNVTLNQFTTSNNFGSSSIYKLTNEGSYLYNNSLRNYNTGTGPNGSLVNTSNIKISKDNLSIYVGGGFQDQIQLYNPNSNSPVNQISAFNQNYNGFVAKFDAITGQWAWLVPMYGSGDDFINKLQYVSSTNKIVFCGYSTSEDLLIYQKQSAGSLTNPIVFQSNIAGSVSTTNSFVVCVDPNGAVSWFTNSFSDESSTLVNFLDIGSQGDQIVVSGYTNAGIIQTIDGTSTPVQNLYSKVTSLGQNALVTYTFNTSGLYLKSTFVLLPPFTQAKPTDIKLFTDLNLSSYCFYVDYQIATTTQYFNKDGTLAHSDTGASNTIISYIVDYLNESRQLDTNGQYYSSVVLANPPPYPFTGGFMTNYSMYILGTEFDTTLNKNFSIRTNTEDPTGTYRIILNNAIDTAKIDRNLFSVNGLTGSNEFYNINISSNPLSSIFEYNISAQPTVNNTITSVGLNNLNTTLKYYLTFPKAGEIVNIPVLSVSVNASGDYVFQLADVNDLREYPGGPFYGPFIYLTSFNKNVFYNLQFFPANITTPVYYTISLRSLVLPNRPLRQPDNDITILSSMPYIYLAIYCVDVNDKADTEIVNIVYDNNPNRENVAIFQLNTIAAGDASNFVTYSTTMTPRIKFLPKFNTLRVQLFDRNGDLLLFDNTPYKTTDAKYKGGVVPPSLMNISVQFLLTKIA
jgi:hypothetical protein